MNLLDEAKSFSEQISKWYRDLHQMPEIGMNLPKTSAYVQEQLKEMGIPFQTYCDGNAIVATLGKGDKAIALRADMDALAIPEETGLPFASKNGNMHACGHDGHTSILLGTAKLLKAHEAELKGTVKLFFQPAEETFEGAPAMIEAGVLKDHPVQAFLAEHGLANASVPNGHVVLGVGGIAASGDFFDIRVKGKGCHGAMPESGVDPVTIAAEVIHAIQTMIAREVSSQESAIVSVCSIRSRTADEEQYQKVYNVIPNCVEMAGTIRTLNNDVREYVVKRLGEIVEGICKTAHAEGTCEVRPVAPVLMNAQANVELFEKSAKKLLPEDHIHYLERASMGSEDAAFFQNLVPGCYFNFSNYLPIDGKVYPLHNTHYADNEENLPIGAALMAQGAMDWLEEGK